MELSPRHLSIQHHKSVCIFYLVSYKLRLHFKWYFSKLLSHLSLVNRGRGHCHCSLCCSDSEKAYNLSGIKIQDIFQGISQNYGSSLLPGTGNCTVWSRSEVIFDLRYETNMAYE